MVRKIQRIQKTPRSEWEKLIKIIYGVLTEEQKKEIIQKIKKDDVDKSFTYKILKIPKSTFYFWLKKKEKTPYKNPFEDKIIEIFYELEAKCGWEKVQKMLEIKHGITLNERTVEEFWAETDWRLKQDNRKNVEK
ncbi:Uncharacterised protein [Mesomycoplasma dispar]|uniref:Uncharacterized protein n=1 Tax=Mesomycoplasma dispar TaxID=86660 RepID=A0AAJ5TCH2_9BACT|nr:hypothetical protein [Mesomycoplasma dispar]VEU61367.1 Uncharacterised protein [Mesomycoplasma dispar]